MLLEYNHCLKSVLALLFLSLYQEMSMSKPKITQVFKSVLAAFVGIQSEKNRKKDFETGSLSTFVIAGLIFTILFVCALIFLVSTIV